MSFPRISIQSAVGDDDETTRIAIDDPFDRVEEESGELVRELRAPTVLAIASLIATLVWDHPFWPSLLAFASSYLVTRVVKKLTDSYDLMRHIEEWGVALTRVIPYIHITATICILLFCYIFPVVSYCIAAFLGVLTAITIDS